MKPVGSKVAIESKESAQAELLRCDHERRIREIHGQVGILPHQSSHPFPFPITGNMQIDEAVDMKAPELILGREATRTAHEIHRFGEAGDGRQEWLGRERLKRCHAF